MSSSPPAKNNSTGEPVPRPSLLARGLVSFIGISRTLLGVGCLLAPAMAAKAFGFSTLSPEAALLARMVGAREIVIGEGLLLAERNGSAKHGMGHSEGAQRQVTGAIWGNVATDGLDIVAVLLTLGFGVTEGLPVGKMSILAGLFVVLGFEAAWMYK